MRYVIAQLCIDDEGKYSMDVPQPDQGGAVNGLGTVRVGSGSLEGTLEVMQSIIKQYEDTIKARIGKKNESNT